ncbi:MAG TPA: hypothetical protein VFZ04_16955, partial [Longimicrobiales bacterium]
MAARRYAPSEREQASAAQQPTQLCQLALTPDKGRELDWQETASADFGEGRHGRTVALLQR